MSGTETAKIHKYQWNSPGERQSPKWAKDIEDEFVRPTNYGEVNELLGTSGCSKEHPYWDWVVLGVLETTRGRIIVHPGDWVVLVNDEPIAVLPAEAQYYPIPEG